MRSVGKVLRGELRAAECCVEAGGLYPDWCKVGQCPQLRGNDMGQGRILSPVGAEQHRGVIGSHFGEAGAVVGREGWLQVRTYTPV